MDYYHTWFDLKPGTSDVEFAARQAQLDRAFVVVSARANPIESLHAAVNQQVAGFRAALHRGNEWRLELSTEFVCVSAIAVEASAPASRCSTRTAAS